MTKKKQQDPPDDNRAAEVVEACQGGGDGVSLASARTDKIFAGIEAKVVDLLRTNKARLMASYKDAIDIHNETDSDKKFKYSFPVKVSITGQDPDTYEVTAKIASTVKWADERTILVKTGEDMVDLMGQGATVEAGDDDEAEEDDEAGEE